MVPQTTNNHTPGINTANPTASNTPAITPRHPNLACSTPATNIAITGTTANPRSAVLPDPRATGHHTATVPRNTQKPTPIPANTGNGRRSGDGVVGRT